MRPSAITKTFRISYGHLLPGHRGKCANLHGHNARIEVAIEGLIVLDDQVSDSGMVMDFGDVKTTINEILDQWDHKFLAKGDEWPVVAASIITWVKGNLSEANIGGRVTAVEQLRVEDPTKQIVIVDCRTTAENLARLLYLKTCVALNEKNGSLFLKSVRWWETDDGCAEYTVDDLMNDSLEDYGDRVQIEKLTSMLYLDLGREVDDAAAGD